MLKSKDTIALLAFAVIICIHIFINYYIVPINEKENQNNDVWIPSTCRVEYNAQFQNSPITNYDIACDLVFFSYSEGISAVEAYDLNGKYVFSIVFSNLQKGSVLIRGEEDRIYIRTKSDDVFVFERDCLIEILSKEDANAARYDHKWFTEKKSELKFVGIHLRRLDSTGAVNVDVPVPIRIIWNYYKNYSVFIIMGFAAVGFAIQRVTRKRLRCRRVVR